MAQIQCQHKPFPCALCLFRWRRNSYSDNARVKVLFCKLIRWSGKHRMETKLKSSVPGRWNVIFKYFKTQCGNVKCKVGKHERAAIQEKTEEFSSLGPRLALAQKLNGAVLQGFLIPQALSLYCTSCSEHQNVSDWYAAPCANLLPQTQSRSLLKS